LIAFLGDGSFRDTLGILQKVLSGAGGRTIDRATVERITGAPPLTIVSELFSALIEQNIDHCYTALRRAEEHNVDVATLIKLLLQAVRLTLMYRYSPSAREEIAASYGEQYTELITRGAVEGTKSITSQSIISLITALERVSYAAIPTLPLELACIEITGTEALT
ncbi:MAG TPA: hypothetical protein VLB02_00995, partial [Candidatus Paceibacterota bacterium]|nr:hypothetical protein [Candidatus Paceibacterota bacterium]